MLSIFFHGNEPYLSEDAEVFGDGGLGEAEVLDEVVDALTGGVGEEVDDVTAAGFGDGVEGVGGCGGSGHGGSIFLYGNMSRGSLKEIEKPDETTERAEDTEGILDLGIIKDNLHEWAIMESRGMWRYGGRGGG